MASALGRPGFVCLNLAGIGQQDRLLRREALLWPVAIEANSAVTLTEQPLLFLRDQKGAAYLLLDRDKAFPAEMETVTATAGAAAGAAGGGAAPAGGAGAGAKAKVIYVDHWMSDSDVAVFKATLDKLDELLRQNRAAIQKLQ